jgi:hypothetical protein
MFILRTINSKNNTRTNEVLGDKYGLIPYTEREQFESACKSFWGEHVELPKINTFAFIYAGSKMIPLFKDEWYYVMTGNGSTFESLNFKE